MKTPAGPGFSGRIDGMFKADFNSTVCEVKCLPSSAICSIFARSHSRSYGDEQNWQSVPTASAEAGVGN